MTEKIRELLENSGYVPVVTLKEVAKAPCLVRTLRGLGIDCAVVRENVKAAAEADSEFLALAEGELTDSMIEDLGLTVAEVPAELNCDGIAAFCRSGIQEMLDFRLAHVGINCPDEAAAISGANNFDRLFGWKTKIGNSSVFAGSLIECMKKPFLGKNGHIAVAVRSVPRAVHYLTATGVSFNYDTAKYKDEKLNVIYLSDEYAGFAVHFIEKK